MKGGCGVYCKRGPFPQSIARDRVHPAQKPVELLKWCMDQARVPEGATVLDPYMGSGTTGVACIRTGRKFIGIEIDAGHFATARKRLENELRQGMLPLEQNNGAVQRCGDVVTSHLMGNSGVK
jgi:DNA modification methylase